MRVVRRPRQRAAEGQIPASKDSFTSMCLGGGLRPILDGRAQSAVSFRLATRQIQEWNRSETACSVSLPFRWLLQPDIIDVLIVRDGIDQSLPVRSELDATPVDLHLCMRRKA
jgi:hypothetical protein